MNNIKRKIKILGIAPYEGMRNVMHSVAQEREDIELTTFVADLEEGVQFVSGINLKEYDAILSRGGTALMIKKITTIPVFDMTLSYYDLLNVFKLVENLPDKKAIVCYPSIADFSKQLCAILDYDINIFITKSWDDTERIINQLIEEEYTLIIGDMSACRYAKEQGVTSMLITSGSETIRAAIDQIVEFSRHYLNYQLESTLMKGVISSRKEYLLVFDEQYNHLYASVSNPSNFIINEAKKMIPLLMKQESAQSIRLRRGTVYSFSGSIQLFAGEIYYCFYITMSKNTHHYYGNSITSLSPDTSISSQLFTTLYTSDGYKTVRKTVNEVKNSFLPILIIGEEGTGKDRLAEYIYKRSSFHERPLFIIDCATFSISEFQKLMQDYDSPFHDNGFTFYFKNCNYLEQSLVGQMVEFFVDSNMHSRNKLIFSWKYTVDQPIYPERYNLLKYRLSCITIELPNLLKCIDEIPKLAAMYINKLNIDSTVAIFGLEPEALSLLQGYKWTYNLDQLKRVLNEAFAQSQGPYIVAATIERILREENKNIRVMKHRAMLDIDLKRPLRTIIYDIVNKVLVEENMNQSRTAKRLGISRTTLWRILKNEE